jgi:hypothetical protein
MVVVGEGAGGEKRRGGGRRGKDRGLEHVVLLLLERMPIGRAIALTMNRRLATGVTAC